MNDSSRVSGRLDFGKLLKRTLVGRFGSVAQAAKYLNCDYSALYLYINGRSFPQSPDRLGRICTAAGIDAGSLDLPSLVSPKYFENFGISPALAVPRGRTVRVSGYAGEDPEDTFASLEKISDRKTFGKLLMFKACSIYGNMAEASRRIGLGVTTFRSYTIGSAFPESPDALRKICEKLHIDENILNLRQLVFFRHYSTFGLEGFVSEARVLKEDVSDRVLQIQDLDIPHYKIRDRKESLIIGDSPEMTKVFELLNTVVLNPDQDSVVLITGETGTGKELAAKAIHYNSPRTNKPFVGVNITALPETLLESELFGHKKGAFTGAVADARGFFEETDGGTLFLDEIGYMTKPSQARLLRVLQEREFYKVGETKTKKFDGRVLVATREKLEELIQRGEFREDLFYRINVVKVEMPPLRERQADIFLLFNYFIRQHNNINSTDYNLGPTQEGGNALRHYSFPGNIRELQNLIKRAIFYYPKDKSIRIEHFI